MNTVQQIIETIGPGRIEKAMGVGAKSLEFAMHKKQFTASWYNFIRQELEDLGYPPPDLKLFKWKPSKVKRRKK